MPLFTIGHGNRSIDEFVELLRSQNVGTLIDVRRFPGSRRHPHFSRDALDPLLAAQAVAYEWRGEALGGRRRPAADSPNIAWRDEAFRGYADFMSDDLFQAALHQLIERNRRGERIAVMCAETLWWRCHRRLIADALVSHGVEVHHIIGPAAPQPHTLHEAARRLPDGQLVYDRVDVEQTLPLFAGPP